MIKFIRNLHTLIVNRYIPDDGDTNFADALFDWKYGK